MSDKRDLRKDLAGLQLIKSEWAELPRGIVNEYLERALEAEEFIEKFKLGVLYDELAQLRKTARDCANCEFKASNHYRGKIAYLTEENDIQRQAIQNLSAQVARYKNEGDDVNAHNDHGDYYHRDVPASYTDKLEKKNANLSAQVVGLTDGLNRLRPADGHIHDSMPNNETVNLVTTVGALREINKLLATPDPGAEIRERLAGLEVLRAAVELQKAQRKNKLINEVTEALASLEGGGECD